MLCFHFHVLSSEIEYLLLQVVFFLCELLVSSSCLFDLRMWDIVFLMD